MADTTRRHPKLELIYKALEQARREDKHGTIRDSRQDRDRRRALLDR